MLVVSISVTQAKAIQKNIKKTIFDKLRAKKRPILLRKVSSQLFLGINEVKIMSKLYSININQYNSVTQRLQYQKHLI